MIFLCAAANLSLLLLFFVDTRYCHVYGEGELPELVASTPGLRLVETFYDTSNWCVIAEKEG